MATTIRSTVLLALLGCAFYSQLAVASEPITWDYKVLPVLSEDAAALQAELASLGEQGWDLNGVVGRRTANGPDLFVFKRSKIGSNETSQIETKMTHAEDVGNTPNSNAFGKIQIEFVDETGIVTIRGLKSDVSRAVDVIQTIEKAALKPK